MTGYPVSEPTLADVQARYPHWACARGISGLYHATHRDSGERVTGEDPLDLGDQIKGADARCAWLFAGSGTRRSVRRPGD